jgi:hypothetical protein
MRNRRSHGRRGLSTVITTLLMVAAVSVMGAALMQWSSSSFAAQQLEISTQANERINLIKENFVVEDVWFYENSTGSNFANVTIRNTGELALTVSKVYINNTQAWDEGLVVLAGDIDKISIETPWETGRPQSFWIVTERGAEIKQTWKS